MKLQGKEVRTDQGVANVQTLNYSSVLRTLIKIDYILDHKGNCIF